MEFPSLDCATKRLKVCLEAVLEVLEGCDVEGHHVLEDGTPHRPPGPVGHGTVLLTAKISTPAITDLLKMILSILFCLQMYSTENLQNIRTNSTSAETKTGHFRCQRVCV